MIEFLESRVLMHGADLAPGFSALQVVLNGSGAVPAARAEADASRAQLVADTQNAESELRAAAADLNSVAATGKATLRSDRANVAATKGEPAANAEARRMLAVDAARLKVDLAEAKNVLKVESATWRATLKAGRSAVKADEAALRTATRVAATGQRRNLAAMLKTIRDGSADGLFSEVEIQRFAADLAASTVTALRPSESTVAQLAADLPPLLNDAGLAPTERKMVLTNVQAVMNSANVDGHDVTFLIDEVVTACTNKGASDAAVLKVAQDLYSVYFDFAAQV